MLESRRIVLGVSGGIAAYKAIEVCRRLIDQGAHVSPVLTQAGLKMVGAKSFDALASEKARTSLWDDDLVIPHTYLGQSADAIVVCPATARVISDLRTGRSDDLLTATLLATEAPVVVCPAMHTEMWNHPAVVENIGVLVNRGVVMVGPEKGRLAGGDVGVGRLAATDEIVAAVAGLFRSSGSSGGPAKLTGRRVVVTAGGTREAIDPVRFVGNRSSGKQGHAIAEVAADLGAEVTLITTSQLVSSARIERVEVESAAEMAAATLAESPQADLIVMAAAVADFRPKSPASSKIKKSLGVPQIGWESTEDILVALGNKKPPNQVIVGFAAESDDVEANAKSKLESKGADFVVANDISAPMVGFGHDTNAVTVYGADGQVIRVPVTEKIVVARAVLDAAAAALVQKANDPQ